MGISIKDIVEGRKTFFIAPDVSLIPESYLEDYFAMGYECYFIDNDKRIPLDKKLDIIISTFDDVILFFNVDAIIQGISWPSFIKKIVDKYHNKANIGVMYVKRQAKDERAMLGLRYLYDMELNCGCIQLEYQKRQNFEIIEKILFANQAQGKRRNIRAICTKACTFSCVYNDKPLSGILQDISLSHFSLVVPKEDMKIKLYDRIKDVHIGLRGVLFRADAVLMTKREIEDDQVLCVFGFISSSGAVGLDSRAKQMLIPNIYRLLSANCMNLLAKVYNNEQSEDKENVEEIDESPDSEE